MLTKSHKQARREKLTEATDTASNTRVQTRKVLRTEPTPKGRARTGRAWQVEITPQDFTRNE